MLTVMRAIVMAREDTKNILTDTDVKLQELFDQDCKVDVPAHPTELARLESKLASLMSDLKRKKLELQLLLGLGE